MEIIDFKTGKPVAESTVEGAGERQQDTEQDTEEGLIRALEGLLALAKAGHLRSMVFTGELSEGNVIRGWTVPSHTPTHSEYEQYGAITAVAHAYYLANIHASSIGEQQ